MDLINFFSRRSSETISVKIRVNLSQSRNILWKLWGKTGYVPEMLQQETW